jgi:hypothetical protein
VLPDRYKVLFSAHLPEECWPTTRTQTSCAPAPRPWRARLIWGPKDWTPLLAERGPHGRRMAQARHQRRHCDLAVPGGRRRADVRAGLRRRWPRSALRHRHPSRAPPGMPASGSRTRSLNDDPVAGALAGLIAAFVHERGSRRAVVVSAGSATDGRPHLLRDGREPTWWSSTPTPALGARSPRPVRGAPVGAARRLRARPEAVDLCHEPVPDQLTPAVQRHLLSPAASSARLSRDSLGV